MKDIIIKDELSFRLKLVKWECLSPKGLYAVNFVQAVKDKDGNIESESIYEFFMDQQEMAQVAKALVE